MENAVKLTGFAVCAALLSLILRQFRPEMRVGLSLGAGALLVLAVLPALASLMDGLSRLSALCGLDDTYMRQLVKIAGIALLMDFAAQTCRDVQEEALALKVEFCGRVLLLSTSLPVLQSLLSQLLSLSPS